MHKVPQNGGSPVPVLLPWLLPIAISPQFGTSLLLALAPSLTNPTGSTEAWQEVVKEGLMPPPTPGWPRAAPYQVPDPGQETLGWVLWNAGWSAFRVWS